VVTIGHVQFYQTAARRPVLVPTLRINVTANSDFSPKPLHCQAITTANQRVSCAVETECIEHNLQKLLVQVRWFVDGL